ncbi:tetratricopeptide repeat protein [Xenophilus sp. Marseille-Q4582]|uniref:tetratricopeptide repeat protein n=1 Tax=Xenophilus sp. Marseille-Q4582 TaxID=2866600 RepID=UPI001CE40DAB|nr:tetratricopeptide repeat protein [Xenophilus sp. Marseille-Q4582]
MNGFLPGWALALLVFTASAQSQTLQGHPEDSTPATRQKSEQASGAGGAVGPNETDFASLIAAQRFTEAFPLIERHVMLHPNDVAAWLDYARVVRALGRFDESLAVLSFIERELAPDARARQLIAAIAPPPERNLSRHRWRGEVSLLTGRESNANAGPSVRGLTFNIPGETPVTLELAPQSLPQPSSSHLVEARLESSHALGQGMVLSTLLDWRQRNTPDFSAAGSRQWQADAMLSFGGSDTPSSARQWFLAISTLDYNYGGSALFQRERAAVGIDQRFGLQSAWPCRIQGSVEREWRHHPTQDGLLSDMHALQLAGVCAHGRHRWTLLARAGEDRARGERPGGTQYRQDLAVGYRMDLSAWGQVEMQASYAHSRDAEFYSILFGDVRRRLTRSQLNLSYLSAPFQGRWQVIARAEVFHQRANIGLFRLRGNSAHVGLRYTF